MGTSPKPRSQTVLSELRPYRRRLIVLVVLAALGGGVIGELAPRGGTASTSKTSPTHSRNLVLH